MNGRRHAALSAVLLCACGMGGSQPQSEAAARTSGSPWAPLPADELIKGRSLDEWLVEWKRWGYSQTSCDSPSHDPDGSLCGLYQDPESPVFFLDLSPDDSKRTKCRVPSGKAIAVPLAEVWQDNVGLEEPLTDAEMEQIVSDSFESMRDLEIEADGVSFEDRAADYAVEPRPFTFDLPPTPNWISCNGYGEIGNLMDEPGWIAGYIMLFPPPAEGRHELRYGGVTTYLDEQYHLTATTTFVVE